MLALPTVTLCAATSVNVAATLAALRRSAEGIAFADCILLTDAAVDEPHPGIRIVPIARLTSASDYSAFVLGELGDHVATPHCLLIQWDGFVTDPPCWQPSFLDFDYIGAPWPQFGDDSTVGNGGFSLRSRRLLDACRDPDFKRGHPEDVAICRSNRRLLEERHGIRFADPQTASRFAFERSVPPGPTFGFHGIFNLAAVVGIEEMWRTYRSLDEPGSAFVDHWQLMRQLGGGRHALRRRLRLTLDRLAALLTR